MINLRTLVQLAKKWQRMAALRRRQLTVMTEDAGLYSTSSVAAKGHCIMYTADGRRFEVPLAYLGTMVFTELLRMSQEEFGFTSESRITLPCDAAVMEYVMRLLMRKPSEEVERAVLSSVVMPCNYGSCMPLPCMGLGQPLAIFIS